jgi:hypothetical protein
MIEGRAVRSVDHQHTLTAFGDRTPNPYGDIELTHLN